MLGFTSPMDAQEIGDGVEHQVLSSDADREVVLLGAPGTPAVVRVRARSAQGRDHVRAEMHLLASLEVEGLGAAPAVLEVEEDGYVREAGRAVSVARPGKRAGAPSSPGAQERQALARARADLEALVGALHDRHWVLGAPLGQGLGCRQDGTVTVLDLSGLRPDASTTARLDDRLWVDSVLLDQDRTLRRRIDPAPGAPSGGAIPEAEPDVPTGVLRPQAELPAPRALGAHRSGRVLRRGQRLLRDRRDVLAGAAAVVLGGLVLGTAGWQLTPGLGAGQAQRPESAPPAAAAPTEPGDGTAPPEPTSSATEAPDRSDVQGKGETGGPASIADPGALALQLAVGRHAYVTGSSDEPVALEGSAARAKDDQVREAYAGLTVHGGDPEVHGARLLAPPTSDGTASLRVEVSTAEHTTVAADGTTRRIPAGDVQAIRLDLRWDGDGWLIESATPV